MEERHLRVLLVEVEGEIGEHQDEESKDVLRATRERES